MAAKCRVSVRGHFAGVRDRPSDPIPASGPAFFAASRYSVPFMLSRCLFLGVPRSREPVSRDSRSFTVVLQVVFTSREIIHGRRRRS